jgi:hypothetical protein
MIEAVARLQTLGLLKELAEEIYFRAQHAKSSEERAALKGVQHSIELVLEKHQYQTFVRPATVPSSQ